MYWYCFIICNKWNIPMQDVKRKTEYKVYGNSLYYLHNHSVSLKLLQNKKIILKNNKMSSFEYTTHLQKVGPRQNQIYGSCVQYQTDHPVFAPEHSLSLKFISHHAYLTEFVVASCQTPLSIPYYSLIH